MRKILIAWLAAVVVAAASSPAQAQLPSLRTPSHWPPRFPSWGYPIWPGPPSYPGYPSPGPIHPRPRPPAVQIRYSVFYRTSPYAGWHLYARYASHEQAARAERRLHRYGYETDLVVTY